MSRQQIQMNLTRKKAMEFFKDMYSKEYLRKLTDRQLLELGVKEGFWHLSEMEIPL